MGVPIRLRRSAAIALASSLAFASFAHLSAPLASAAGTEESPESIEPADTLELTGLQARFQQVADRVSPSVVAISASIDEASNDDTALRSEDMNAEKLQSILDRTTRIVGTGFIVDPDGYIVTNEHVIGEAGQLWITTDDRRVFPAIVIGSDPRADLAVLKIPAAHLPAAHFSETADLHRGEWSIALGNPFGLATDGEMCMSVGVISATDRSLPKLAIKENRLYTNLIQTTAQINPGNSGGPLFDLRGTVIGINTAVILPQKQSNGIGFAIPVTPHLLDEIRELEKGEEIVYGYVGVTVGLPTDRERRSAGVSASVGVRVDAVEPDSPAAATALKVGDLIAAVNGQAVHDTDHFVRLVGSAPVDHPSRIQVYRDGRSLFFDIIPKKRPIPSVVVTRQNQRLHWRGLLLGPIPANWQPLDKSKPTGLLVLGVESDSPLKDLGVTQGSIITSVAGHAVKTVSDLLKIINDIRPELCNVELADSKTMVSAVDH